MWNSLLVSIYITPEYQPQEFAGEEFYFATIEEFEIAIDKGRSQSREKEHRYDPADERRY